MSFQYEEQTLSTSYGGNAFASESISYSTGASALDANASISSSNARRATNQIAQDLLLAAGAGVGSAGSFGDAAGSASYSASYSVGGGLAGASVGAGSGAGYGSTTLVSSSGAGFGGAIGGASATYLSDIEQAILRSSNPIEINESEEITVNGQRGIWANRAEVVNWRGVIPITEYQINVDTNPEIITKRTQQQLEYIQELAIRYLRPPTPPAPGEIIINQQANLVTPPAPPLVIRQQPARPATPEPLIVREAPPQPPAQVGRKVITISGKRIPPPPRKVIIERLAPLPAKPQSVIVERWLPYAQVKRKVIFQRSAERDPVIVKPRNIIVQWEAPAVTVRKEIKYLGVIRANPAEYVSRYGATLKQSVDLPTYVTDIKTPDGLVLAADYRYNSIYELEGDLQALKLVDLDREGLAEYRAYLQRLGISYDASASSVSFAGAGASGVSYNLGGGASFTTEISSNSRASVSAIADQIFNSINRNSDNKISIGEAESAVLRINSTLGRSYGADEVRSFFARLDSNRDGFVDFDEFRRGFFSLFSA